jgi:hypothetical protein
VRTSVSPLCPIRFVPVGKDSGNTILISQDAPLTGRHAFRRTRTRPIFLSIISTPSPHSRLAFPCEVQNCLR